MLKIALITVLLVIKLCESEGIVENEERWIWGHAGVNKSDGTEIKNLDPLKNDKSSKNEETLITSTQRSILTTVINAIPKTGEVTSTQSTTTNGPPINNQVLSEKELELALNELFGNTNAIPEHVYQAGPEVTLETTTQTPKSSYNNIASINDSTAPFDLRIGRGEKENHEKKKDFKFIIVDWDKDFADNFTESDKSEDRHKPDLARRDYDGEDESMETKTEATIDNDNILLNYPIAEVDPPIDIQGFEHGTTTEDPDSAEIVTSPVSFDNNDLPQSCNYGTPEYPYPEPKIVKSGRRIVDIKCEEQMWHMQYRVHDVLRNEKLCAAGEDISTVFGGLKSEQGAFPHMGAVGWYTRDNDSLFFCGTSLITSWYSVTAAHCRVLPDRGDYGIDDLNPKIVRFGAVVINDANSVERKIEKFITPKEYNGAKKYNDIALIQFNEEITFTEYIQPACIWHTPMDELKQANVTGWGATETEKFSSHLKYAGVDILDDAECNNILQHRVYRKWDRGLIDSQFCAGKQMGGADTCQVQRKSQQGSRVRKKFQPAILEHQITKLSWRLPPPAFQCTLSYLYVPYDTQSPTKAAYKEFATTSLIVMRFLKVLGVVCTLKQRVLFLFQCLMGIPFNEVSYDEMFVI